MFSFWQFPKQPVAYISATWWDFHFSEPLMIQCVTTFTTYSQVPLQCGPIYRDITYGTVITVAESEWELRITRDTPCLALTGELWDVYSEDKWKKIYRIIMAPHCISEETDEILWPVPQSIILWPAHYPHTIAVLMKFHVHSGHTTIISKLFLIHLL